MTSDKLNRQDGLIKLASIGNFSRSRGLFHGAELDKGVVPFHVDSNEFTVRLKEHLEVFSAGSFFVEVDDKESFGGPNVFFAFVFLFLDAAVASGEFGAECVGNLGNGPEEESGVEEEGGE